MSSGLNNINLKVLLMDTDFYALRAVNSYLAWDRRTRVTLLADSPEQMWQQIKESPYAERPDVVIMDADHFGAAEGLRRTIIDLHTKVENVMVVCLAQFINPELVEAAAITGAKAYMLKQEVRLQIAWAVCYSVAHDFVVTPGIAHACEHIVHERVRNAAILPKKREYPELTDRVRQAVMLCVVEGMPAHLAADEMGISLHTGRSYIKEGYRILEAHDESEYPVDMTPQERAFMRFTALVLEDDDDDAADRKKSD